VLEAGAWGYADAEGGSAFTKKTLFRMCSVTKQFTCALVLKRHPDLAGLDGDVADRLPRLEGAAPRAVDLCHNQSGLRDYWTLAMMQGAGVEQAFGEREAADVLESVQSLQFAPGTRYSYCNQNFRMLSDAVAARAGTSFAELLRREIFEEAEMESAFLAADTRSMPDGAVGYEGDPASGHRPAVNRILWTGDAGLGASLNDMIAWERWIDRGAGRADSLYARMSAPVSFADGRPAFYGFGLAHGRAQGRSVVGHGGALRGWRSHRLYCPAERISVVVMLNHLSDAHLAATALLAAALGETEEVGPSGPQAPAGLLGVHFEPETGLAVRIAAGPDGGVLVRYGHHPELAASPRGDALASASGDLVVGLEGGRVRMTRERENQSSLLEAVTAGPPGPLTGTYACPEARARLVIEDAGGALYGAFEGPLGRGRFEALEPLGRDLYHLPCRRALDHTPPGEFTLLAERDRDGRARRLRVGCWLARNLLFDAAD
jgi:D-aminopeptidase